MANTGRLVAEAVDTIQQGDPAREGFTMSKKILAAGLIVAAAFGIGMKPAIADTVGVTVIPGERSASTTDLVLPAVYADNEAWQTAGMVTLWADDSSGTGDGWTVTVQAGAFACTDCEIPSSLPASSLSAFYTQPVEVAAGQAIDEVAGPHTGANSLGSLDVARPLMAADAGAGMGTYSETVGLLLNVPAFTMAGTYSTTLTVSITAAP